MIRITLQNDEWIYCDDMFFNGSLVTWNKYANNSLEKDSCGTINISDIKFILSPECQ